MKADATENETLRRKALRAEVEKDVVDACKLLGPAQLDRAAIVAKFANRGASRATLFRWVSAGVTGPEVSKAMRALLRPPAPAPEHEAQRAAETAAKVGEIIAGSGIVPSVASALAPGLSLGEMVAKLTAVVETAEQVVAHAKTPDGKIRMAKTALAGGAAMRDGVLAMTKLLDSVTNATNVMQFISEVIALLEAVGRQHPQVGHLMAIELINISRRWGVQS